LTSYALGSEKAMEFAPLYCHLADDSYSIDLRR
jgi:hypothetical protein